MKKLLIATLLAAPMLAGCATQEPWQSMVFVGADRDQAFDAALAVLSEDYLIAQSDRAAGEIRTRPLMVPRRGTARTAGAYLSSGDIQNVRRTVTCWVDHRGEESTRVRLRAALERESTNQAATLVIGTEGGDMRGAGEEPQWRHLDPNQSTYWADIGRDTQAETELLRRIGDRLAPAGTVPPAARAAPATAPATVPAPAAGNPAERGVSPAAAAPPAATHDAQGEMTPVKTP
jgi:hypothetical protein